MDTQREWIDLDGTWEFYFANDAIIGLDQVSAWRPCSVPMPWQAQFDDLRNAAGHAWYRRYVNVPREWRGSRIILRFGAVNYLATVFVNGRKLGENEGGYLPFEIDAADAVRFGEANEIAVLVTAPTDDPALYPGLAFSEVPFGKQSWYGFISGIWQSVRLERRGALHIMPPRVRADLRHGTVSVQADLSCAAPPGHSVAVRIAAPDGTLAAEFCNHITPGCQAIDFLVELLECLPWSPDDPALYRLTLELRQGKAVADSAAVEFGFRIIETRNGRLFLNDQPIFLRAALDQDYYPDTIATTPSEAFLEDQFRKAKALGLNCLRCHIKAPDPLYYAVADRVGMMVWNDLPNCGRLTDAAAARAQRTLQGIVDRDGNHPSIICWTIVNENWGTDLVHNPEHRGWLKAMYAWLKAYDPTRLVVDNSPIWPSMHVQTDVEDIHFYTGIPDHRQAWDTFIDAFASRTLGTFSVHGDAIRTGQEPLVVSEFGNWGLPDPQDLRDTEGQEPWWFETGHDWGDGVMYPHGIEHRFRACGLDRVYCGLSAFVRATQWQQFAALKYQIERMRCRTEIAGYVITELTDCHWEANGLLDMRRNPRVFHNALAQVNADIVVVPRWERTAYRAGETVRIGVAVANGGALPILDAELRWSIDGIPVAGRQSVDIGIAEVKDGTAASFTIPDLPAAAVRRLELELSVAGRVLAINHLDLQVYPRRAPATAMPPILAMSPDWTERLSALGYVPAETIEEAGIILCERLDETILSWMRQGGRVLLLADSNMPLQPAFPHWQNVRIVQRQDTAWQGDWASSFSWLRRTGPFARIPGEPLLDHGFDRVIPTHVILGCNFLDFQARVHAGIVVGWIHKPAAFTVERAYGRGRLVVSTFRLKQDAPHADATATALLDALLELARTTTPEHIGQPQLDAAHWVSDTSLRRTERIAPRTI